MSNVFSRKILGVADGVYEYNGWVIQCDWNFENPNIQIINCNLTDQDIYLDLEDIAVVFKSNTKIKVGLAFKLENPNHNVIINCGSNLISLQCKKEFYLSCDTLELKSLPNGPTPFGVIGVTLAGKINCKHLKFPDYKLVNDYQRCVWIMHNTFENSDIVEINNTDYIDYIGRCAFKGCKHLKSIQIDFNILKDNAFENSGIEQIRVMSNRRDKRTYARYMKWAFKGTPAEKYWNDTQIEEAWPLIKENYIKPYTA